MATGKTWSKARLEKYIKLLGKGATIDELEQFVAENDPEAFPGPDVADEPWKRMAWASALDTLDPATYDYVCDRLGVAGINEARYAGTSYRCLSNACERSRRGSDAVAFLLHYATQGEIAMLQRPDGTDACPDGLAALVLDALPESMELLEALHAHGVRLLDDDPGRRIRGLLARNKRATVEFLMEHERPVLGSGTGVVGRDVSAETASFLIGAPELLGLFSYVDVRCGANPLTICMQHGLRPVDGAFGCEDERRLREDGAFRRAGEAICRSLDADVLRAFLSLGEVEGVDPSFALAANRSDLVSILAEYGFVDDAPQSAHGCTYSADYSVLLRGPERFRGKDVNAIFKTPAPVRRIGEGAFANAKLPKADLVLPESVGKIERNAFESVKLRSLTITNPATEFVMSEERDLAHGVYESCKCFFGIDVDEVTLPEGIEVLPASMFGSYRVGRANVPASVASVGQGALSRCNVVFMAPRFRLDDVARLLSCVDQTVVLRNDDGSVREAFFLPRHGEKAVIQTLYRRETLQERLLYADGLLRNGHISVFENKARLAATRLTSTSLPPEDYKAEALREFLDKNAARIGRELDAFPDADVLLVLLDRLGYGEKVRRAKERADKRAARQ